VAAGRRRWGRALLILALVLIVLLIGADRIGVMVAEQQVADQTKSQLTSEDITTSGTPSVHISGFPFLTQVLSGKYDKITIDVPHPTSKGIQLDAVHVVATGVNAPMSTVLSGGGQIEADKVTGTARMAWTSFQQMVDLSSLKQYGIDPTSLRIAGGDDGQIHISVPATILNQQITLNASGRITVSSNVAHVKITDISAADGTAPTQSMTNQIDSMESQLSFDLRIPDLPYHLVINGLTSDASGVTVNASSTHVILGS
jgi:hypothetical protein